MHIRKNYEHEYEGHTPRNTKSLLFGFKSHETYKISANKLQESSKS
jgi:hypothetical protein